jgi:hypothetical protein
VGIHVTTFEKWMQRGAEEEVGPHRELRDRIERARAEGEARNVALIAKAATDSWQAAAWLLERQHPERWARRPREVAPPAAAVTETPPAGGAPRSDPFSEVDDLAARRRARGAP